MVCNNLNVGSHALNSVARAYFNVINDISTFVETNPPTNIIKNKTILKQYIIKHGIKDFGKKGEAEVQKELHKLHELRVVDPKNLQELRY